MIRICPPFWRPVVTPRPASGNIGNFTPAEGYKGGNGSSADGIGGDILSGGGGGAGGPGQDGDSPARPGKSGNGGIGIEFPTGSGIYYAAGGGGGTPSIDTTTRAGDGGSSIGGNGGDSTRSVTSGAANTGSGGGGGKTNEASGAGAAGIAIFRYKGTKQAQATGGYVYSLEDGYSVYKFLSNGTKLS